MNTWLQLAIALMSLVAAGASATQQVRKRFRAPTSIPSPGAPITRPTLNGFTDILREALDKLEALRKENEQLRIHNAELEANIAALQAVARPRRTKSAVGKVVP